MKYFLFELFGMIITFSAIFIGLVPVMGATATATKPPNILFIMSDDHAFQAISAYGSDRNTTPNIDRLAKEGMKFDRCVVTNSICGPVRAVIQTGKYSHKNGFLTNGDTFNNAQPTFPKMLQQHGYQTAVVGKWHLVSPALGYDYSEILIGQGPYFNPLMIQNGEQVRHQGYTTEIITERAINWLQDGRDKAKPFMLMMQHKAPHRDWSPTPKYYNRFEGVVFPEPPTLFDDYENRGRAAKEQDMSIAKTMTAGDLKLNGPQATWTAEQKADWHAMYDSRVAEYNKLTDPTNPATETELVRWKYQCYMRDYLSCVAAVDDSVGEILKYLDDSGLADNTVVIYNSDQGFYLGEHGWFDKRFMYQESFGTPLLVRYPGVTTSGSVNRDIVSNVDFAETFLDIAGAPIPADMQGRSFVPLLKGETPADWRKSFYYHYYEYPQSHAVKKHEGVYDGRYKLIHFYDDIDEWELYDMETDPMEMKNVFADPKMAAEVRRLEAELERVRTEVDCPKPVVKTQPRVRAGNTPQ